MIRITTITIALITLFAAAPAMAQISGSSFIQSKRTGKFLKADGNGHLVFSASTPGDAEVFVVVRNSDGTYAFKHKQRNAYVYDAANYTPARAVAGAVGAGEKFRVFCAGSKPDGAYNQVCTIRSYRTNRYLYDPMNGTPRGFTSGAAGLGELFIFRPDWRMFDITVTRKDGGVLDGAVIEATNTNATHCRGLRKQSPVAMTAKCVKPLHLGEMGLVSLPKWDDHLAFKYVVTVTRRGGSLAGVTLGPLSGQTVHCAGTTCSMTFDEGQKAAIAVPHH